MSTRQQRKSNALFVVIRYLLVLYCRRGHPLLGRASLSKADLDAFPVVSIRIPPRAARIFPGKGDLDPDTGDLVPHIEVDELVTARTLVLASDAFGVAAPVQIEPWLRAGEIGVLPYRPPWLKLDYGFVYLRNRSLAPAAMRFMSLVREIEAELSVRNCSLMQQIPAPPPTSN